MFCIHYICFLVISDFKFADLNSYLLKYRCEVTINGDMKNFYIAEDVLFVILLCVIFGNKEKYSLFLTYDNHLTTNSLSYCAFIFLFGILFLKIKCKIDTANEM